VWLIVSLSANEKLSENVTLPNYIDSIGSVLNEVVSFQGKLLVTLFLHCNSTSALKMYLLLGF